MTVGELIKTLKGCREHLSYVMWKQAYLIARACFDKDFPQEHAVANPELVERPTIHVEEWIIKGADNYAGKQRN